MSTTIEPHAACHITAVRRQRHNGLVNPFAPFVNVCKCRPNSHKYICKCNVVLMFFLPEQLLDKPEKC